MEENIFSDAFFHQNLFFFFLSRQAVENVEKRISLIDLGPTILAIKGKFICTYQNCLWIQQYCTALIHTYMI